MGMANLFQSKSRFSVVLICMGMLWPAPGAAQSSVGTGPLTSTIGCTQYYMNHAHTQGVYAQQGMLPGE